MAAIIEEAPQAAKPTLGPEFTQYIIGEIQAELESGSRKAYLDAIAKWRRQRRARPEQEIKSEPFPVSTNLAPPLTQSKVNTIFGKTLAGFSLKRPLWGCDTNDPMLKAEADAFARLLNAYAQDQFSLNLKPVLRKALYNTISLGTQFYELGWALETVTVGDSAGGTQSAVVRSGPVARLYKLEDVIINQTWTDLQKAPWVALRFTMTLAELLDGIASGRYDPETVEAMKSMAKSEPTEAEAQVMTLNGIEAAPATTYDITKTFDVFKFYARWLDGDTVRDYVGVAHLDSGRLLYVEPNPIGWRIVGRIGYFEDEDSLYSIGVCHQCEYLQEEVEMLHNLAGDAMKWSSLGMFKARKDAGIRSGERIYPGKIWLLDNLDDLKEMRFAFDMSPAMVQEANVLRYADMATGANQAMSGQADTTLKSGGGSQAQQILMQASSTILDAEFDTLDEAIGEMGKLLAILVITNKDYVPLDTLVNAEDADTLRNFFALYSTADVVAKFRFSVKTTDIQRNDTTKRETLALFSQLYNAYIGETLQLMAQTADPKAQAIPGFLPFVQTAIAGKTQLIKEIADFLHVGDLDRYFPKELTNDGTNQGPGGGLNGAMAPGTGTSENAGGGLPPELAMAAAAAAPGIPGAGPQGTGAGPQG